MSMLRMGGTPLCADAKSGANAVAASNRSVDTVPRRNMARFSQPGQRLPEFYLP